MLQQTPKHVHCPDCHAEVPDGLTCQCGLRIACPHGLKAIQQGKTGNWLHATEMCAICLRQFRTPKVVRTKPVHSTRVVKNPASEWTIGSEDGLLTICGVCHGIASDYTSRDKIGIRYLVAFIKTGRCKHCNESLPWDYEQGAPYECESPKAPDGICRRKWFQKRERVPACKECSSQLGHVDTCPKCPSEKELCRDCRERQYDIPTDDEHDLDKMPDGRIRICHETLELWKTVLRERGLL